MGKPPVGTGMRSCTGFYRDTFVEQEKICVFGRHGARSVVPVGVTFLTRETPDDGAQSPGTPMRWMRTALSPTSYAGSAASVRHRR